MDKSGTFWVTVGVAVILAAVLGAAEGRAATRQ